MSSVTQDLNLNLVTSETKKDISFFGTCGILTGAMLILHHASSIQGERRAWASDLFSDFVSFNAFGLVFLGLITIGSFSNLISGLGKTSETISSQVRHLDHRLVQILSPIMCFTSGVAIFAAMHWILAEASDGLKLVLLIMLFNLFLLTSYLVTQIVSAGMKPFNHPAVAGGTCMMSLGTICFLAAFGA